MLVLVAILLGAAYYGWRTVLAPVQAESAETTAPGTSSSKPSKKPCYYTHVFKKGQKFTPKDVKVNVFNAGDITGLAGDTMAALVDKGFRKGSVANAPSGVSASSVVLYGAVPESPLVQLVREQFKGEVKIRENPNPEIGIDVVVGNHFAGFVEKAPDSVTVHQRTRVCLRKG